MVAAISRVLRDRFRQRRLKVEVQATTLGLIVAKHRPSDCEIGVGWRGDYNGGAAAVMISSYRANIIWSQGYGSSERGVFFARLDDC